MINSTYIQETISMIRIFFIIFNVYNLNLKIINCKIEYTKYKSMIFKILFIFVISHIVKIIFGFIWNTIAIIMLTGIFLSKDTKNTYIHSISITMMSLSINYILFVVAVFIDYILYNITYIKNDFINLIVILIIYDILIYNLYHIQKFKNGICFLKSKLENEYFEMILLAISIVILFCIIILENYEILVSRTLWATFIIFSIIMFITIQKSLQLYYKQKLLIQDLNETKEELKKKNEEIKELEKENLNFSKTSHSIAHKQKSLEYKLNQLMLKNEIASEIDIKDRINDISKQIYNKTTQVELEKTSIIEIDDMLKYMQSECIKNKIDFQIQISGNIYQMINNHISKENLEILLADHIKNAIIAINHSNSTNKSILVRLGMINGIYSLYVYDSGIEFEIETLLNLGKRPSTTHADSGGTGMGFMNTFDTLNKYKASMIITEYNKPCKDKYTKVIKIKFDKKNEFQISTYRDEQIKNKDTKNNLIVEKIS